jgi:hypothetical protein
VRRRRRDSRDDAPSRAVTDSLVVDLAMSGRRW